MESQKIFGISRSALCYNAENCKKGSACKFRHPIWLINLCVYNLVSNCNKPNCGRLHVDWCNLAARETVESSRDLFQSFQPPSRINVQQGGDNERQWQGSRISDRQQQGSRINDRQQQGSRYEERSRDFRSSQQDSRISQGGDYRLQSHQQESRKLREEDKHDRYGSLQSEIYRPIQFQSTEDKNNNRSTQREEKPNKPIHVVASRVDNQSFIRQMRVLSAELKMTQNLDVLLFLDCTSSMERWIEEAKKNLLIIIKQFRIKSTNFCFRVGFVGYRDTCDGPKQFVLQQFTGNVDEVVQLISTQKAIGGGDSAEDLCGALKQALRFDFEKRHSLHCFLICDAPCHGQQYHGPEIDDDEKVVEVGTLERLMRKLQNITEFVRFTCIKVTQHTDQMFGIMQKYFKGLEVTPHSKPEDFSNLLVDALQSTVDSLNTRLIQNLSNINIAESNDHYLRVSEDRQSSYIEVKQIAYKFPKIQQKMTRQYWEKIFPNKLTEIEQTRHIKIKKSTFNEGMQSYVFDVEMSGCNMEFVVKIPKLVEKDVELQLQQVKQRMVSSAYAYQLTRQFRQVTHDIPAAPLLFYVPPMRFVLKHRFQGMRHLYAEPKLKNSEDFEKISSNWDCCRKQAFASFSHFTFMATEGYLIVNDLQGAGFVLTDPAIQSDDKQTFQEPTNLGNTGIAQFFVAQHPKCNLRICYKLGLERPEWESRSHQSLVLLKSDPDLAVEETNAVCELCYSQEKVNLKEYRKKLEKMGFLFACKSCRRRTKVKKNYTCITCKSDFQDSPYFYACFGLKEPRKCKKCKYNRQKQGQQ